MPVIKNQPLPDGHPLKDGLIVFGQKQPNSSETSSEAAPSGKPPRQELEASRLYEQEISKLPSDTVSQNPAQPQSLESTILANLGELSPGTSTEQD